MEVATADDAEVRPISLGQITGLSTTVPIDPDYDYHDRRQEVFETPEQKLRTTIIKLGEAVSSFNPAFTPGMCYLTLV
jgi:hypothetical protein